MSLSPVHFTILLSLTWWLNRPCLYCSLLLIILFSTSCSWSQTCLIDFNYISTAQGGSGYATWFLPRIQTIGESSRKNATNETMSYVASVLADTTIAGLTDVASKLRGDVASSTYSSSTLSTIKELFKREWIMPCIGARVVL